MHFQKLDELPDEILTEISDYFEKGKEVLNFMMINKAIYEFVIDRNGRIYDHYGYCCKNVRFRIVDRKHLKHLMKHLMKKIYVRCEIITNDINQYLLDVYDLFIYNYLIIKEMKCFENCNINILKIYKTNAIVDDDLKYLKNIKCLDISNCCNNVSNEGLKYLSHLEKLYLHDNHNITDYCLKYLENIHTLKIDDCSKITNEGLKYLKKIYDLNISVNMNISDDCMKYLSYTSLHRLNVSQTNITDGCLEYLPKTIRDLDISINVITDECMKYLSSTSLHRLSIRQTYVTNECLKHLPTTIIYLDIGLNSITDDGISFLSSTSIEILDISCSSHLTNNCFSYLPKTIRKVYSGLCINLNCKELIKRIYLLYLCLI